MGCPMTDALQDQLSALHEENQRLKQENAGFKVAADAKSDEEIARCMRYLFDVSRWPIYLRCVYCDWDFLDRTGQWRETMQAHLAACEKNPVRPA